MIQKNRLDKSFGPSGTFAGYIIFIAGLIATYSNLAGLALVVIGAFVGFSSTGTVIDLDQKKIKFSNYLFGFIPAGKWIDIVPTMKVGIKESNITWTTFSRSNRSIDTLKKDFRVVLCDTDENEIMELRKNDSFEEAMFKLDIISQQLGLSMI